MASLPLELGDFVVGLASEHGSDVDAGAAWIAGVVREAVLRTRE